MKRLVLTVCALAALATTAANAEYLKLVKAPGKDGMSTEWLFIHSQMFNDGRAHMSVRVIPGEAGRPGKDGQDGRPGELPMVLSYSETNTMGPFSNMAGLRIQYRDRVVTVPFEIIEMIRDVRAEAVAE